MTRALERLVEARPGLLESGERLTAAGRAQTVAGTASAELFPASTIWAVSDRRLFVFDAATKKRRGLGAPVAVFDIAESITGAGMEPFDDRSALLVVQAREHPARVVMDPDDAHALVDGIVAVLDAIAPSVAAQSAPISQPDRSQEPTDGSETGVTEGVAPLDASAGDERVAAARAAFADGDWEQGSRIVAAPESAADREWLVRHLPGEDLADGLDAWVAAQPDSPSAYLARGANTVWTAWAHRTAIGDEVFFDELRQGELDLFWSVELDFADPVPFTPLMRSGLGLQVPLEELCMRFDESVRRGPNLLGVHLETLVALGPSGLGATAEMLAFARSASRAAGEGSPVHALVPLAHLVDFDVNQRHVRRTGTLSSEAIREVELARAMSLDSSEWSPGNAGPEVLNIFAATSVRSGAPDQARSFLAGAGWIRTDWPWSLLTDGDELFASIPHGADESPAGSPE